LAKTQTKDSTAKLIELKAKRQIKTYLRQ